MKRIFINCLYVLFFLFILVNIFIKSSSIHNAVNFAFVIWKDNLFPTLFPMFVLSEILISFGFVELISELGKPLTQTLFHTNKKASYVFLMGMLTGFPSSAKYIVQLYEKGEITTKEANKILLFSHFSNPLFIIGTIATTFLGNPKLTLLLFISHYVPNIIIGIFIRNYHPSKKENTKFSFINAINAMHQTYLTNHQSFGTIIGSAVLKSINTLLLILGTISLFLIFTTILNSIFPFSPVLNSIINGIFEMSQGLKYVSLLGISLQWKTILSVMMISFGGFSVHLQITSILNDLKINYFFFLLARIFHALLAGLLVYLLFPFFI